MLTLNVPPDLQTNQIHYKLFRISSLQSPCSHNDFLSCEFGVLFIINVMFKRSALLLA